MKFSLFAVIFALLTAFPLMAQAIENESAQKPQTEEVQMSAPIRAIAFHSDTCGSCKILGPRMMKAMTIINKDKLDVIKFDFTNKESIEKTKILATTKNVDTILQKYGARTGFVVLINSKGDIVDTLKVDDNTAAIASKMVTAIANAS